MQRFVTIFFALLFVGTTCIGCEYLSADDSCYPTRAKTVESCSEYDTMLEYCNSEVFPNVNGCYTVEVCPSENLKKLTDADADADIDTDTNSNTTAESLPAPAPGCHFECQGNPVPCDVMDKGECENTIHCQWWHDPNNIDEDLD